MWDANWINAWNSSLLLTDTEITCSLIFHMYNVRTCTHNSLWGSFFSSVLSFSPIFKHQWKSFETSAHTAAHTLTHTRRRREISPKFSLLCEASSFFFVNFLCFWKSEKISFDFEGKKFFFWEIFSNEKLFFLEFFHSTIFLNFHFSELISLVSSLHCFCFCTRRRWHHFSSRLKNSLFSP